MFFMDKRWIVSTHSRLKAAGAENRNNIKMLIGFNTQPPKGGWHCTSP